MLQSNYNKVAARGPQSRCYLERQVPLTNHSIPGNVDAPARQERWGLCSDRIEEASADPVLDQMTATLAQVFSVPLCCVSLVDESRVWFKSRYGVDIEHVPASDDNPCVHTVRSGQMLVIRDLWADPTFRCNPMVSGDTRLRFYAAAPLLTGVGKAIGTICIMDTKPGPDLTDRDRMLLRSFAATIVGHIELRNQSLHMQHLATAHRLLANAIDQTGDAIIVTDTQLGRCGPNIVYANAAFSRMMGYTTGEIIGNTPHILRGEQTDAAVLRRLGEALIANSSFEGETVKYRKDGSAVLVNWKVSPVRDDLGRTTNYISTYRDVTGERAAEKNMAEARDKAEQASRAKSAFLAAMSHEIRTPLNGIIGNAELLAGTQFDTQQAEMITGIRKSSELLLSVVNDILDFSKIEAGRIQLERIEFSLVDVVRDLTDLLAERADRKDLELSLEILDTVPDQVLGDPQRLRQVLLNIMGNAIKFTDEGGVTLRVSAGEQIANRVVVTFEVADTGIGIAPENRGKLFESFSQVDASMARRYGGTGLGLAISKRLVDCMQGSVTFDSVLGSGSTFVVAVPFEVPDCKSSLLQLEALVRQTEVTVVLEPASWLARKHPSVPAASIQSLRLGAASPTRAESGFSGHILIDVTGGAESSVLDLAQTAKAITGTADRVFVLVPILSRKMTRVLRKAGLRHIAPTPLRAKDLCAWLGEVTQVGNAVESVQRPSRSTRVLLVEDNQINQRLATRMLNKLGCEVQVADNGLEAVERLRGAIFDLIFMDCQMPILDGMEATRTIRDLGCSTPIIALTAHALSGDRDRCLAAGMNDFLTKPVYLDKLANAVEKWAGIPGPSHRGL